MTYIALRILTSPILAIGWFLAGVGALTAMIGWYLVKMVEGLFPKKPLPVVTVKFHVIDRTRKNAGDSQDDKC